IFLSVNYLLDPHTAVALHTADQLASKLNGHPVVFVATPHPPKFPEVIKKALACTDLPAQAQHPSIELAKRRCEQVYLCDHSHLEEALTAAMEYNWKLKNK
ncbi:MAG: threonine synthase, partial [Bacteroidota bacterium]